MRKEIIENLLLLLVALLAAPWVALFFVRYYGWIEGVINK